MTVRYEHCVIIGTGLIGASLAGAGKARGVFGRVTGVGRRMENLETARSRGLIDEATTKAATALESADLVVLATPVLAATAQLHELIHLAPDSALFTDVGSVKQPIVAEARKRGLGRRFLGAHPLAGKAQAGSAAADPDLFRGRRVVLTPDDETPDDLVSAMTDLWTTLEAHVSVMDAEEHDEVLARSSHLPQMVAFALAATADASEMREKLLAMIAGGFRDTTRLASSDVEMWVEIARLNREAVVDAMDEFSMVWDDLRDAVSDGDETVLRELMEASRRLRREIVES